MKSFHFYRQYYKGEYEKYSPFVACLVAVIEKSQFELKAISNKSYALYNKIGKKTAILFFDKKEKKQEAAKRYILITSSEILFELNNEKIRLNNEASSQELIKHFNFFFRQLLQNTLLNEWSLLEALITKDHDNYIDYFEEAQEKNSRKLELKNIADYFENTLPKEVRINIIKNYLFYHVVFHYCISKNKYLQDLLQNDEIYSLFLQTHQIIKIEILKEDTISCIKRIVSETHDLSIFLNSLLGFLNTLCSRARVKLVSRNTEYLSKSTWAWIENKAEKFNNNSEEYKAILLNSTQEVLQMIEVCTSTNKVKLNICAPNTFDYYLSIIESKKLRIEKVYLLDIIQKQPLEKRNNQKSFFSDTRGKNKLPQFKSFDYTLIDLLNHPVDSNTILLDSNGKAHRRITLNNKLIASNISTISNLLKNNGVADFITNNHLLYNSIFKDVRFKLKEEYDIKIIEFNSTSLIEKVILLTLKKDNTRHIHYQKTDVLDQESSYSTVELKDNRDWFNSTYLEGLKLYSPQKNDKPSVFIQQIKGAFYSEKKVPQLIENKSKNNRQFISKPFGKRVSLLKSEKKELVEQPNRYINLGINNIGSKAFALATNSYPVFNFFPKLISLSMFKDGNHKLEINISDRAYTFLRKAHINSLENRFFKNILLKDEAIGTCLEKLSYLCRSLPVLQKFVVQLRHVKEKNKGQRVSYVIIECAEIIEKFNTKRKILSKNAKERKRLLSSISKQLQELKEILHENETHEINCQKELIALSKENIFYYCLALLNSDVYQHRYGYFLLFDLPRIYYENFFYQYVLLGRNLFELFQGNLSVKSPLKVSELDIEHIGNKQFKIKLIKKLGSILVSDCLEISGISQKAWDYQINGKSPIEWRVEWLRKQHKNTILNKSLKEEIVRDINVYYGISLEIQSAIQKINALQGN